jgi:flagellar M-ring protein FliF
MDAFKELLRRMADRIKEFWRGASRRVRILVVAVLAGVVLLLGILISWLTYVPYVPLIGGLGGQEHANVLTLLVEAGVDPQISSTGMISVPERDIHRARMAIARRATDSFGYDLYMNLGMTATQADKNQMSIYQRQENLRAMIETHMEVERAYVELNIPQPSIYAIQNDNMPPTASIRLEMRQGYRLTPDQIQGIINVVKYSISGLTEENIGISDHTGDLKAQLVSPDNSAHKLHLTEQVNASFRNRVLQGLQPVFGADNITVAVNSVLDIDDRITQEEIFLPWDDADPTNNPINAFDREREWIRDPEGPAQGVPGATDNIDVPLYGAEYFDITGAESGRIRDIYDFLVSSVRSEIRKEGLEITDMSVAVIVNTAPLPGGVLSDAERDRLIDWTMRATGLTSPTQVSVHGMRFVTPHVPIDPYANLQRIILLTGIALLALAIIFIMVFLNLRKRQRERLAMAEAEIALAAEETEKSLADLMNEEIEYEPIQLVETQEQKLKAQIRDLAITDPEIVAQLIKTWLVNA